MPDLATIPLWFKAGYTAFVALVAAVWLKHYGWRNFLWMSDVAFFGGVPALWLESRAAASVLAAAALLPELAWNADLLLRLTLRRRVAGLTEYMFEAERPLFLRLLSLFHIPLPLVLVWMLAAWGYDPSVGLAGAVLLWALVLPASRLLGSPQANINWSYGPGRVQTKLTAPRYLGLLFACLVLLVVLPTHRLLAWAFA